MASLSRLVVVDVWMQMVRSKRKKIEDFRHYQMKQVAICFWFKYLQQIKMNILTGLINHRKRSKQKIYYSWTEMTRKSTIQCANFRQYQMKHNAITFWLKHLFEIKVKVSKGMINQHKYIRQRILLNWREATNNSIAMERDFRVREEEDETQYKRKCRIAVVLDALSHDDNTDNSNDSPRKPLNSIRKMEKLPKDKSKYAEISNPPNYHASARQKEAYSKKLHRQNKKDVKKIRNRNDISSSKSSVTDDKEKKRHMAKRREEIMKKHLQSKKECEKKKVDLECCKDNSARMEYLTNKRQHEEIVEKKKVEMEEIKKGLQLSRLHYLLTLLRRCLLDNWMSHVEISRLNQSKATTFWSDALMYKCWNYFIQFVNDKRQQRKELERNNYKQADKYYEYRLCESIMKYWSRRVAYVHVTLVSTVQSIRMHHQRQKVLGSWKSKASYQKLRLIKLDKKAQQFCRAFTLRRIIHIWNQGIVLLKKEQIEEVQVAEKWKEVKEWITDV